MGEWTVPVCLSLSFNVCVGWVWGGGIGLIQKDLVCVCVCVCVCRPAECMHVRAPLLSTDLGCLVSSLSLSLSLYLSLSLSLSRYVCE